jgi:hypothetical protein
MGAIAGKRIVFRGAHAQRGRTILLSNRHARYLRHVANNRYLLPALPALNLDEVQAG